MRKVLLADDDPTMVSLLTTLLGMEGFQVAALPDQDVDLLEVIRNEKPDALVVDIYLGSRNGLDLVRQIRQEDDLKEIKIIMASGIDRTEDCLAAGANAFLLKPYMPDDLFKFLRS
jgi:CheY-like chemotaxis protein